MEISGNFCSPCAFIALILQIVPKFPRTLILSVLWGFTIAGYIQTMFLNKNLDQIGVSAEGYTANATRVILNALFWLVILAASVLICVFKKDLCTRLLTVTSSILPWYPDCRICVFISYSRCFCNGLQ